MAEPRWDKVIAALKERGFEHAHRRDWAMGKTVVVPLVLKETLPFGSPGDAPILLFKSTVWLLPEEGDQWRMKTADARMWPVESLPRIVERVAKEEERVKAA